MNNQEMPNIDRIVKILVNSGKAKDTQYITEYINHMFGPDGAFPNLPQSIQENLTKVILIRCAVEGN